MWISSRWIFPWQKDCSFCSTTLHIFLLLFQSCWLDLIYLSHFSFPSPAGSISLFYQLWILLSLNWFLRSNFHIFTWVATSFHPKQFFYSFSILRKCTFLSRTLHLTTVIDQQKAFKKVFILCMTGKKNATACWGKIEKANLWFEYIESVGWGGLRWTGYLSMVYPVSCLMNAQYIYYISNFNVVIKGWHGRKQYTM